jgi:hypothetical protein
VFVKSTRREFYNNIVINFSPFGLDLRRDMRLDIYIRQFRLT